MALYSYQALSKEGKRVSGQLDASSSQSVRDQLAKMGLYPLKIETISEGAARGSWLSNLFGRKIATKDLVFFTKQLALLLKSGVPLLQALELLVEQTEKYLRTIVVSLKDAIKEGSSLADALQRYPRIFDTTYVQLVRAGEASGNLDVILNRLTSYLEKRQEVQRRIKKALSYPLFQLGFILIIAGVLLAFVVPQIAGSFVSSGKELPTTTRVVLAISDALKKYYLVIIGVIIAIYLAYKWWRSTPSGSLFIDSLKLKLPIVRYFARMGTVVQFSRTLGMLLEGGVNIAEALSIVSKIVDNKILANVLNQARESIIKQGHIAEYLKKTNLFPPVAIYLISTGEQSGQLDTMLLTVAEYYEVELSDLADSLSSKVGPAMTLLTAVIVGFIVMAIMQPIISQGDILGV